MPGRSRTVREMWTALPTMTARSSGVGLYRQVLRAQPDVAADPLERLQRRVTLRRGIAKPCLRSVADPPGQCGSLENSVMADVPAVGEPSADLQVGR